MSEPLPPWLRVTADGVTVTVAAQPNARHSEVVGLHGAALKIKVASPPVDGAANAALLAFLAESLGLKARDVSLLKGAASRQKVVEIRGVTPDLVVSRLAPPAG